MVDEDRKKAQLYREFYEQNKTDSELVGKNGAPTVEYWRRAREYMELRLREWKAIEFCI